AARENSIPTSSSARWARSAAPRGIACRSTSSSCAASARGAGDDPRRHARGVFRDPRRRHRAGRPAAPRYPRAHPDVRIRGCGRRRRVPSPAGSASLAGTGRPVVDGGGLRAALAPRVGAAGIAGALLSFALPGFEEGAFLKTATAVTAGALLHVVSDEIRAQRFGSRLERALDLVACAAGLAVAGFGAVMHLREEAPPLIELLRVIGGISLACAPAILVGCAAGALLAVRTRFFRWDAFLL